MISSCYVFGPDFYQLDTYIDRWYVIYNLYDSEMFP